MYGSIIGEISVERFYESARLIPGGQHGASDEWTETFDHYVLPYCDLNPFPQLTGGENMTIGRYPSANDSDLPELTITDLGLPWKVVGEQVIDKYGEPILMASMPFRDVYKKFLMERIVEAMNMFVS
jgi:hypothetical protein